MNVVPLNIDGIFLFEPHIFRDRRGEFSESFRKDIFQKETSLNIDFVQDNHTKSFKGVLRGLHYQLPPFAQGKLVRVIQGEILDIVVDLRKSSATFGKHISIVLSEENKKQLWIPEGFAHGFLTLSDSSEFLYKTTNFYNPLHQRCIRWDDSTLGIMWPKNLDIKLSSQDLSGQAFESSELFP